MVKDRKPEKILEALSRGHCMVTNGPCAELRLDGDLEILAESTAEFGPLHALKVYGGSPGAPSENYLNPDADNQLLPSKLTMIIKKGDVFRHVLAGAGGWGDPLERDPALVLRDVRNELLSPQKALADYGVAIDTSAWTVDAAATTRRRAAIRQARGWTAVPKVQWHDPEPLRRAAE